MAEEQETVELKNTVTIEEAGPCKKKVTIEIPQEAIKNATDERYNELRREAIVPGFRKGRAPRRLLEKRFGKDTNEQIKLKLLLDASEAAIKDHELATLTEPDIDFEKRFLFSVASELQADLDDGKMSEELRGDFENNKAPLSEHATVSVEQPGSRWLITDELKKYPVVRQEDTSLNVYEELELPETGALKFEFEVDVRPEFELPELEGIPVEKQKLEITDEQIDREIEQLRKWSGVWTPREKGKVELDDQVIADVVLKAQGLKEKEEEEQEEKLDNVQIFVRPNGFVGRISVEKLDELLVGAESGDTKETTVEVPRTFFREEYRGKKVDIKITIKDIKWLKPAELDKDFLARAGVEDQDELREKFRDTLQSRLERQSRTEMTEQIYKYLLDNTDFDLPLDIVAAQSTTLLQRQYGNLLIRGLPREKIEEQMEQLQASSDQQAEEQLKTFFIMDKVAEKLGIEVSEEEINGRIAQLAIQRGQRPERMREQMARDGSLAQFSLQVRQDRCIAQLLESAKVTEKEPDKKARKAAKKAAKKTTKKAVEDAAKPEKKESKKRKTTAKKKTGE